MLTIGIDPGRAGAAAVLADESERWRLVWIARWRPRGSRIAVSAPSGTVTVATLAHVGAIIGDAASELVVDAGACEGQHVQRGRGARSALTLAQSAGLLSARCVEVGLPWWWPTVREWRPLVGIPTATRRDDAKRWAVDVARTTTGHHLSADEAEAVCIAIAAQRHHQARPA